MRRGTGRLQPVTLCTTVYTLLHTDYIRQEQLLTSLCLSSPCLFLPSKHAHDHIIHGRNTQQGKKKKKKEKQKNRKINCQHFLIQQDTTHIHNHIPPPTDNNNHKQTNKRTNGQTGPPNRTHTHTHIHMHTHTHTSTLIHCNTPRPHNTTYKL